MSVEFLLLFLLRDIRAGSAPLFICPTYLLHRAPEGHSESLPRPPPPNICMVRKPPEQNGKHGLKQREILQSPSLGGGGNKPPQNQDKK